MLRNVCCGRSVSPCILGRLLSTPRNMGGLSLKGRHQITACRLLCGQKSANVVFNRASEWLEKGESTAAFGYGNPTELQSPRLKSQRRSVRYLTCH